MSSNLKRDLVFYIVGGDPDALLPQLDDYQEFDNPDENGNTALTTAAMWGLDALVRALLERGANVNAQAVYMRTALHLASCAPSPTTQNQRATVFSLLKEGANIDARDVDGMTSLMWAAWKNNLDVVDMLIDFGANVNLGCYQGRTALTYAHGNVIPIEVEQQYERFGVSGKQMVKSSLTGFVEDPDQSQGIARIFGVSGEEPIRFSFTNFVEDPDRSQVIARMIKAGGL